MNSTFISIRNLACVLGASALLSMAGCGSGGGGGGGSAAAGGGGTSGTPVTITATQSQTLAKVSLTGLGFGKVGTGFAPTTGIQIIGASQNNVTAKDVIATVIKQVEHHANSTQTLVGANYSYNCPGGGTVAEVDTTTSLTITYSACIVAQGSTTTIGGSVAVSNVTFGGGTAPYRVLTSATMNMDLTVITPAATAGGASSSFVMVMNVTHSVGGTGCSTAQGVISGCTQSDAVTGKFQVLSGTTVLFELSGMNFSSSAAPNGDLTESSSFTFYTSTLANGAPGSITIATPQATPMITRVGATYPNSGVMEVTSSAGTGALRMTAHGDELSTVNPQVTVDYFPSGFSGVAQTPVVYSGTWALL